MSAPFDIAFVGGVSLALFAFVKASGQAAYSDRAVQISVWLMWVVNWPHFSATVFRLFRTRESAMQYPVTAFVVPVVVLAGAAGAFLSPGVVAPFFVKLFLVWSPYHFSGQSVGISLLYARRAGLPIRGWQRVALSMFVFGTYATSTLLSETSVAGAAYYGIEYPGLGVPLWLPRVTEWGTYAGGLAFLAYVVRWAVKERRALPFMVLLPGLTQYVWFIGGSGIQPFYVFVPFFHSLQYLPIAWAMQLGERHGEMAALGERLRVGRETLRWLALNLAGGAVLFWGLPHAASAAFGVGISFATGVLIAGVQIHHFFVDGVIWKLRNPRIASPLLSSVRAYFARPEEPLRAAA